MHNQQKNKEKKNSLSNREKMEEQNDADGPITQREIQERKSHISRLLYDYPLEARLRKHGQWRHVKNDVDAGNWELIPEQKDLVESFGFNYVNQIEFMQHDRGLLFNLAELWWPQRNTFQLPVEEMTVTLWDVANILGLPITDASVLIRRYLGVSGPTGPGQKGRSEVSVSWLRSNFMFLDPHLPPVHIPPDYPSGNVSQRRSRYATIPTNEEEVPSYHAGEGTSYQSGGSTSYRGGEGTSYQYGEGTSYHAAEGTPYQYGEGISYHAAEGTPYQYGEETSYHAAEGTPYQYGQGTSYHAAEGSSYQYGEGTSYHAAGESIFQAGPTDWFRDIAEYTRLLSTPAAPVATPAAPVATPAAPVPTQEESDSDSDSDPPLNQFDPPNLRPNRQRQYARWIRSGRGSSGR